MAILPSPKIMKQSRFIALLISWSVIALTPIHPVHAAAGNPATLEAPSARAQETLSGRVTNAATGKTLEGARVELQGSGRSVVTDDEGEYRFPGVAAGAVMLSVSYTGL